MAVTPLPVVNPYVKAYDPNAVPQPSTTVPNTAAPQQNMATTQFSTVPMPSGNLGQMMGNALAQSISGGYVKPFQEPALNRRDAVPTPDPAPTPTPTPTPAPSAPSIDTAAIRAEAAARIAKQRSALAGSVDASKTGLKNTYDYTQGRLQDARNLETNQFQRSQDPFNLRTDYLAANMLRDRGIADTASQKDYAAATGAEDAKLSAFDTNAPAQEDALYNELLRIERDFGLQQGALTGSYNNAPTLAAKTADQNYGLGLAGLSGQLPASAGGGQTQQAQAQGFNQNLQTQQFAYQQARDSIKDKQYQQTFDEDVRVKGLDYALKQATLQNQITNDQAQRSIGYMNANTSAANAGTSAGNLAWSKDPNNPDNIYKNAQIHALENKPATPKSPGAYKSDPNFSEDVTYLKNNPSEAKRLETNPQPFIDTYGYDGYLALKKEAGL